MRSIIYFLLSAGLMAGLFLSAAEAKPFGASTKKILESYVEDFRLDPAAAKARVFGIRISGKDAGEWNVAVSGAKDSDGKLKHPHPPRRLNQPPVARC